jgi:hypothetical protein
MGNGGLTPTVDAQDRLRELGQDDRARAFGWRFEGRSRLAGHDARLTLHACDLLADDADWDARTWLMAPGAAQELAESIDALLVGLGVDAVVEAVWEGETPTEEQSIARTRFVDLVRRGSLGTHTRYRISPR